jgi:hypothetical protein
MVRALTAAAMILLLAPSAALAQERATDAALGAVAGAVVLGPIGAVAGAFVGYSAGPSISRSWGVDRSRSARHRRQASKDGMRGTRAQATNKVGGPTPSEREARVATSQGEANNSAPAPTPTAPAVTTPPVQTLE